MTVQAAQVPSLVAECGELFEHRVAFFPVFVIRGSGEHRLLGAALLHADQPFLLGKRKRCQQQRADEAEHGRVGTDSKCEGKDRDDREGWILSERPKGISQVLELVVEPYPTTVFMKAF